VGLSKEDDDTAGLSREMGAANYEMCDLCFL
jgi:hypothetical protein